MLEFIGFIALCFIGYKILIVFLRNKNSLNSPKNAVEIRNFATNELEVPSNYFNYITSSKIEEIKHKGVDEKIADVESQVTALDSKFTNMHQILSETDYAALDKTGLPDGTLFFTFKTEA